jgi:hypothetical protein
MATKHPKVEVGGIVRQIVDRCHVADSDTHVIRYVISRLKNKYQTFAALPKDQRRNLMLASIQHHHENRQLYRRVMGR